MSTASLIQQLFKAVEIGLAVYVLCAWAFHPVTRLVRNILSYVYRPLLVPLRRVVPVPSVGLTSLDLSPALLLIGLIVLEYLVVAILL